MSLVRQERTYTIEQTGSVEVWHCDACGAETIAPDYRTVSLNLGDQPPHPRGWLILYRAESGNSAHLCPACGEKHGFASFAISAAT